MGCGGRAEWGSDRAAAVIALAALVTLAAGCVGLVAEDGSSVAIGGHARGALWRGARLPVVGRGYAVPEGWRGRGAQAATDELAWLLRRAFLEVERLHPGSVAALGDLSRPGGGGSAEHQSHHNGRDADIFFFAEDAAGRPYRSADGQAMLRFGTDGWAQAWSPPRGRPAPARPVPRVRFDARRNWALVRSLLAEGRAIGVHVQWLFIHAALRARLLEEAARAGEPPELVALAAALLHQPGDSAPHDDHLHVRIFCDPADRAAGCEDRGPRRWLKKHWKYLRTPALDEGGPTPELLAAAPHAPD